jgi:hypothetical protein
VLTAKAEVFPEATKYMRLRFALGEGLLTAPLDVLTRSRKAISPSFHADALKGFMAAFNKRATWMAGDWAARIDAAGGSLRVDVSVVAHEVEVASGGYESYRASPDVTPPVRTTRPALLSVQSNHEICACTFGIITEFAFGFDVVPGTPEFAQAHADERNLAAEMDFR